MARLVVNRLLSDCIDPAQRPADESELHIDASDVRDLIRQLDKQFPGVATKLKSNYAVAIDGEIFADPLLESLQPDSEVYFLPAIEGG